MKQTKFLGLAVLGLAMACNTSQKTIGEAPAPEDKAVDSAPYAQSITEADLKTKLYTYASDDFEGRETGKPGQKKAVAYLKAQYEAMGIPAAKGGDDYFQQVPLVVNNLPTGSVTVNGTSYPIGENIIGFKGISGTFTEIVYARYGVEEGDYSDYGGLDVKGKIVLVKYGEPKNADGTFVLSGTSEPTAWGNMSESVGKKSDLAREKGAKALLYFDDANYERYKRYFNYMKANDGGRMELEDQNKSETAIFVINKKLADAILPGIIADDRVHTAPVNLTLALKSQNEEVDSENVVAIIRGSEIPDEYLVISSHLDHIGITADGQINNGADDDGSGTVALLEIAKAFKKAADAGHGPKRSIVFLHVTGEEKGLLGSQYYTDHDPILPLEQTVADLNIDMIGRIDPKRQGERNYIYLIGSDKLSTELHQLSERVNSECCNIQLDYTYNDDNDPNRFYYRSDHYNFAKNNIPIIFYFNGTHDDYHKPTDTPDKINYDLLLNRTRLVFYTAWDIANLDHKLVVDKAK